MSVRRSMTYMFASQGSMFVLQFCGSVVLARLLTPYDMGVYAIAAAIIGIIGIVQAFGLTMFIIRETDATEDMIASAFTINIVLAALLSVMIVVLSVFGGSLLGAPGVHDVMLVLAVIPLIGIIEFRPMTMLERHAEFRAIATLNTVRSIVSTLVTVTLAFWGARYMSIAWGGVAGSAVGAAGAMLLGHRHVSFRLGTAAWRTVLRFGVQQLLINGVSTIAGRLSDILLGRFLGLEALGLWGRASNLHNLLWFNIHGVVARVMMVTFAEDRRSGRSLRTSYLRTVEILTAVLWPSFAGLAILAGPFIVIVYGRPWLPAAAPFAGLAAAAMILVSLTMTPEVFIVCGETNRQVRFELIRTCAGLLLFQLGCLVGLTGVAVARIGEAIVSQILYRPHTERMTDTRWPDYAKVYWRSSLATMAACGPSMVLMLTYHFSPDVPLPLLLLAIASGVSLWLVVLNLLNHPLAEEINRLFTRGRQAVGMT